MTFFLIFYYSLYRIICAYHPHFAPSMFDQQRMLHEKNRANFTGPFTLPLTEINGKTLGLVGGAGKIGTKVATIALALGMDRIIISSRSKQLPDTHPLRNDTRVECVPNTNLDTLLSESDYVSLHTPLNDQTRGTFGRAQISKMKRSAFLINTSRGVSLFFSPSFADDENKRFILLNLESSAFFLWLLFL